MKYVLPYVNPDLDGVCAATAYPSLVPGFEPVIFGTFDAETKYVFTRFKLKLPRVVTQIDPTAPIALVDTHHLSQLPALNFANVVEVIDHHPGGDADRLPNAKIQNELVGAACTLIAERLKKQGTEPRRETAGILAFGVISNTLNFTAPSTSDRDHQILTWLKKFVEIDEASVRGMFAARSDISNRDTAELLSENTKMFRIHGWYLGIAQLELVGAKGFVGRKDFPSAIMKVISEKSPDRFVVSIVDILERTTTLIVSDENSKKLIQEAMKIELDKNTKVVNRILLRKTDFVPQLQHYLSTVPKDTV